MGEKSHTNKLIVSKSGLKEIGISYSDEQLRRMEAINQFPKRLRLSPLKVAWVYQEIVDWIDEKSAARHMEGAEHDT